MRTLKAGENIDFLKMEYIFFLLLHRDVSAWLILFIGDGIHMPPEEVERIIRENAVKTSPEKPEELKHNYRLRTGGKAGRK